MTFVLSCYYLDEPLTEEELRFALHTLTGPGASFRTGAKALLQRRVPAVLPLPGQDGSYAESRERRGERIRAHLQHAGIRADGSRQVVWVMPRDPDWDAVFRYAIQRETGFAPFVAQRWFDAHGTLVRGTMRIIDTEMLVRGL